MTARTAIVNPHSKMDFSEADELLGRVIAYLPDNYQASLVTANNLTFRVKVCGEDDAGWTLDDYVIPRLASGNMFAEETELSKLGIE